VVVVRKISICKSFYAIYGCHPSIGTGNIFVEYFIFNSQKEEILKTRYLAGFLNGLLLKTISTIKTSVMQKIKILMGALFASALFFLPYIIKAQDDKDKLFADSKKAKATFIKTDASMANLFGKSYGYVIFPNIGKGAFIVGGSGGQGAVYEKEKAIGTAKVGQVTVGAQVGGQAYREAIFFENKGALDRFKANKLEFSGQVSAVAAKSGASANAKYADGVAVFTQEISGLMLEAAIGGQKFTYKSL
jgi:lipid-binding SYLF domain-containing protein